MDGSWPYAMPQAMSQSMSQPIPRPIAAGMSADLKHAPSQDYMAPIVYATQCAGCHVKDLQFDKRFDQVAPHDKPEVVQAFLIQKYSDYFAVSYTHLDVYKRQHQYASFPD